MVLRLRKVKIDKRSTMATSLYWRYRILLTYTNYNQLTRTNIHIAIENDKNWEKCQKVQSLSNNFSAGLLFTVNFEEKKKH